MTKKDFVAIARMLSQQRQEIAALFPDENSDSRAAMLAVVEDVAFDLSNYFVLSNPRFNHDRFIDAVNADTPAPKLKGD
ncbi:MAG: hypothetical protein WAY02_08485 [Burkholderiaceae bacterium]